MSRVVSLASLSEREKDSTILVLQGLARAQAELLRELAERSPLAKRRLAELTETYGPRLAFLDKPYVREIGRKQAEESASRNDRVWARVGVEA